MTGHVTLDRENLQRLTAVMRTSAAPMPDQVRLGYDLALDAIDRMLPHMPDLYGPDGCPDIPAVLGRLTAADATFERISALIGDTRPAVWDGDNYEHREGSPSEHRTCGGRSWCHGCGEWCYPDGLACLCCVPPVDPDELRAALDGGRP